MRYLVRVKNPGREASQATILEIKKALSGSQLPRHENFRISRAAIEFDLYEETSADLERDVGIITSALGPVLSVRNLSTVEEKRTAEESIRLAKEMYSEDRFWEVHEELESQWRKFPRGVAEKEVLQGLILLAAAYVHLQKGEGSIALSIIGRALMRLDAYGDRYYHGIDVRSLSKTLKQMKDAGSVGFVDLPLAV